MVLSVQYLRGLAAFMVLLEHVGLKSSQYSGNVLSGWHVGGAGVDLFFLISAISSREYSDFSLNFSGSSFSALKISRIFNKACPAKVV